jgi:hypothetical protein
MYRLYSAQYPEAVSTNDEDLKPERNAEHVLENVH